MIKMKEVGAIFNPQTFIFSPPEELVAVGDPALGR